MIVNFKCKRLLNKKICLIKKPNVDQQQNLI